MCVCVCTRASVCLSVRVLYCKRVEYCYLQATFVFPDFVVCHFDGKLRTAWGKKSDYIAVCVTGHGMAKEKVLSDIAIKSGTGAAMAWSVFKVLEDWGIEDRVIGISTDSTGSNTGSNNGE